jgi:hypothetical protein
MGKLSRFVKAILPFAQMALSATPVGPLLPVVNSVLRSSGAEELTPESTGQQLIEAYGKLPEDARAQLDELSLAFEREHTEQFKAIVDADKHGGWARQWGYMICVATMALSMLGIVISIGLALHKHGLDEASGVLQLGIGVMSMLAPFAAVVLKYNGVRTNEKMMRYAVGMGHSPESVRQPGILERLIGNVSKR